jgi:hypothetical protein
MSENLIDSFYEVIMNEPNPGSNVTKFYCSLFDQKFDVKLLKMFNKFIKLYGREIVFGSVIDVFSVNEVDHTNIFPLVRYFCVKRYDAKKLQIASKDLSDSVRDITDRILNHNIDIIVKEFASE